MFMQPYYDLLRDIRVNGQYTSDRTGTGTFSVFGRQLRFDLSEGFPLLTGKFVPFKLVLTELIWFLSGNTNIAFLLANNNHIWDEWADKDGNLGPVYGKQWRSWARDSCDHTNEHGTIDQIAWVINRIKTVPDCRRLIVSAWNVADIADMALAPCHTMFQFKVYNGKLHCQLYQRSADMFLGVPFNIASYALLTHIIAKICNLEVGEFIHTFGDAHIYDNHTDQVNELLSRSAVSEIPRLVLPENLESIDDFPRMMNILVDNYKPHPSIKAPVAI